MVHETSARSGYPESCLGRDTEKKNARLVTKQCETALEMAKCIPVSEGRSRNVGALVSPTVQGCGDATLLGPWVQPCPYVPAMPCAFPIVVPELSQQRCAGPEPWQLNTERQQKSAKSPLSH